jgi:hypothetical protein
MSHGSRGLRLLNAQLMRCHFHLSDMLTVDIYGLAILIVASIFETFEKYDLERQGLEIRHRFSEALGRSTLSVHLP